MCRQFSEEEEEEEKIQFFKDFWAKRIETQGCIYSKSSIYDIHIIVQSTDYYYLPMKTWKKMKNANFCILDKCTDNLFVPNENWTWNCNKWEETQDREREGGIS